jgi:surfeit locus 1 family protein
VLPEEGKAVLVNRGWIPLNRDRTILPDVPIKAQQTVVTGRINRFPAVGIKLAGAEIPTESWPSVVQVVDSQILAKKLTYPLFPFQIELDKDLPEGYKREWHTSTIMPPEQHTAYAIQWFALALTLTILFFWYTCKKNDD